MALGQNSVMLQFGGECAEKQKTQKLFLFESIDTENQKLYNTFENQPLTSITGGDMEVFPNFNLVKRLFQPYLLSRDAVIPPMLTTSTPLNIFTDPLIHISSVTYSVLCVCVCVGGGGKECDEKFR